MRFLWVLALVACHRSPDTMPAERQFRAWLEAFDAGDRAKLDAYHAAAFPFAASDPPITLEQELQFRAGTGGFEIRKVEEAAAAKVTVLLQERDSDQFARATMEVDAAGKVTRFTIAAIQTPDAFRVGRLSEADAIAALRAELDKLAAADQFSGTVVIAKLGKPIFAQAYGLADREKKVPNTLETKFRIGSMNKMFTATAIVQLVQDGKLALTDTVGKVRPGYPNANIAAKVTIQHMLTHTGGTGDIFGPDFEKHRLELQTHDDYVKLYGERDLEFEPGLRWEYSNYGFVLLGAIIESVTHDSYYERVEAHIFRPAGMDSTESPPEHTPDARRATGYMRGDTGAWVPNTDTLPYRGTSAGGGLSTVMDLVRFSIALQNRTLLDEAHVKLLTTGQVAMPGGDKYAFGFSDSTDDGVRCVGHGGGAPGMNGAFDTCDSGYTIAVLSNLDPPAADRVARFIKKRLPAK
jgi:CubicO group peptidase (beta-lactamase class C family)